MNIYIAKSLLVVQGDAGYQDVIECVNNLAKACTHSLCLQNLFLPFCGCFMFCVFCLSTTFKLEVIFIADPSNKARRSTS